MIVLLKALLLAMTPSQVFLRSLDLQVGTLSLEEDMTPLIRSLMLKQYSCAVVAACGSDLVSLLALSTYNGRTLRNSRNGELRSY